MTFKEKIKHVLKLNERQQQEQIKEMWNAISTHPNSDGKDIEDASKVENQINQKLILKILIINSVPDLIQIAEELAESGFEINNKDSYELKEYYLNLIIKLEKMARDIIKPIQQQASKI